MLGKNCSVASRSREGKVLNMSYQESSLPWIYPVTQRRTYRFPLNVIDIKRLQRSHGSWLGVWMFATYPLILCDSMSARNNASASGPSAADVFSRNRSPALLQLSSHGCTHEGVYHTARVDGTSDARGVCGGCEERARGDDARAVCENGTASDLECASEEMNSL